MDRGQRLNEWIEALERTAGGKLMLTNVLFAFTTKRPSNETLSAVLLAASAQWNPHAGRRPEGMVELIADDLFNEAMFAEPRPAATLCSRVVEAVIFVSKNIDHGELGFGVADEVPAALLDILEKGIPSGAAKGELRGRRPLAWVTTTALLEELRSQYPEPGDLATVIRNRLGLTHYDQDNLLLQVDYPNLVCQSLGYAAPTFLEGGAGVIFRAKSSEDLWGRAVDLETLGDGLPEAVHPPVPFTCEFRIRRIGRPKSDPGFEFNKVVESAEVPWEGMTAEFDTFIKTSAAADPE